jgi:Flp pilus assembly protein TadG
MGTNFMMKSKNRQTSLSERDEAGSAVVEFILIATPLFIPTLIFFLALHNAARAEMDLSNVARQSLRAFVTADNLSQGHERVKFVLDRFIELEAPDGSSQSSKGRFTYNISCGAEKCLTPGTLVRLELFRAINDDVLGFGVDSRSKKAVAVAQGYVDKWRSEG